MKKTFIIYFSLFCYISTVAQKEPDSIDAPTEGIIVSYHENGMVNIVQNYKGGA